MPFRPGIKAWPKTSRLFTAKGWTSPVPGAGKTAYTKLGMSLSSIIINKEPGPYLFLHHNRNGLSSLPHPQLHHAADTSAPEGPLEDEHGLDVGSTSYQKQVHVVVQHRQRLAPSRFDGDRREEPGIRPNEIIRFFSAVPIRARLESEGYIASDLTPRSKASRVRPLTSADTRVKPSELVVGQVAIHEPLLHLTIQPPLMAVLDLRGPRSYPQHAVHRVPALSGRMSKYREAFSPESISFDLPEWPLVPVQSFESFLSPVRGHLGIDKVVVLACQR